MKKKDSRRSFIQKFTLATGGLLAASKLSAATNSTINKNVIKKIKALGFQWETADPFLFCVHHEDFYPEGNENMGPKGSLEGRQLGQDFLIKDGWRMYHGKRVPGFPGHPHRGFETVTVVRKGMVDHSDSLGGSGRYGDGDVQWMTAGKGVQHAEMFPLLNTDKDNPLELFQIWLNLPKANKFVDAHYKMLWNEEIPKINIKDNSGKNIFIEIVAGEIEGNKAPSPTPNSWANDPTNEVAIWNVQLDAGATWNIPPASPGINRTIYFFKGSGLTINQQEIDHYHAAEVESDAPLTLKAGNNKNYILVLQGRPINEPVVQHGPFVMNTREEIQQAFTDYQQTQFGGWPWPASDPVHPRDQGRFARYNDGREEQKG